MGQIDNKGDCIVIDATGSGETLYLKGTTVQVCSATTEKLGFFGTTAVVQQTPPTTGDTNASVSGAGTAAYVNTAYTSSTGTSNYTVADIVKALKTYGILAS